MKNMISLGFMLFLATSLVNAQESFTGVRVTLAESKLLEISKEALEHVLNEYLNSHIKDIEAHSSIIGINFVTTTKNIKLTDHPTDFNKPEDSYENSVLIANYTSPFDLTYIFESLTTVASIHISHGPGSVTFHCNYICLKTDYTNKIPKNSVEVSLSLASIAYGKNIFSQSIANVLKEQLAGLGTNLTVKFNEYLESFDPLIKAEEFVQPLKDEKEIKIMRGDIKPVQEGKKEVRYIDSLLASASPALKSSSSCTYEKNEEEGKSELCFCNHLFPEMLMYEKKESAINLADWGLKGKVMELYEILPELINYYAPDEDYRVTSLPQEYQDKLLTKRYIFMLGADTLFYVDTTFLLELKGVYENAKFYVEQTTVDVNKIQPSTLIQPSGRTVLARFMFHEESVMEGKLMFTEGIAIPPIVSMSPQAAEGFCFEL